MNLYDKDDGFKVFTLEEANSLLSDVIRVTREALEALETLKNRLQMEAAIDEESARGRFQEESSEVFETWAREIMAMGVYPKGYFTVDFKSPIPDTLFCWTYGEDKISHTHKVFESFKDRVPIQRGIMPGFEDSLN